MNFMVKLLQHVLYYITEIIDLIRNGYNSGPKCQIKIDFIYIYTYKSISISVSIPMLKRQVTV